MEKAARGWFRCLPVGIATDFALSSVPCTRKRGMAAGAHGQLIFKGVAELQGRLRYRKARHDQTRHTKPQCSFPISWVGRPPKGGDMSLGAVYESSPVQVISSLSHCITVPCSRYLYGATPPPRSVIRPHGSSRLQVLVLVLYSR